MLEKLLILKFSRAISMFSVNLGQSALFIVCECKVWGWGVLPWRVRLKRRGRRFHDCLCSGKQELLTMSYEDGEVAI